KLRWAHRLKVCVPGQSRISGRRDLNPRPVAAATVLQIQHGKFVAASPRLRIATSSNGFGPSRATFLFHKKPSDSVARLLAMTTIRPTSPISKFLPYTTIFPAKPSLAAQTESLCSGAKHNFGPAGFEPTTCRRGDRSTNSTRQVRRGLAPRLETALSSHGFGPSRETFLFHEKHGIPWRVALE